MNSYRGAENISQSVQGRDESCAEIGRAPLRFGVLLDHPSPHMSALLDALSRRNDCVVQVVYLRERAGGRDWGSEPGPLPFRVVSGGSRSRSFGSVAVLIRMLRMQRVDLWVISTVFTAVETWVSAQLFTSLRIPWVFMNEPLQPRAAWGFAKELVAGFLLRNASGLIGMGLEAQGRYRRLTRGSVPVTSVPYYVDLSDFLLIQRGFNGAPGTLRLLAVGQLICRKGFDVLLAAVAALPAESWTLSIVGDGPLRSQLTLMAKRLGLGARVRFLGKIPYKERARAFEAHDVFVFPSRWDGWGMAPVEALAAGLPVVSTDQVMSALEFIDEGVNGFIVPAESHVELAARLHWFVKNPGRISAMSQAARESVKGYQAEAGASELCRFLIDIDQRRTQSKVGPANPSLLAENPTWGALQVRQGVIENSVCRSRKLIRSAVIGLASSAASKPMGARILVYHLVLRDDRKNFSQHLKYLSDHFQLMTVDDLLKKKNEQNDQCVAISFDDTFKVLLGDALELLDKHQIRATFFAPIGFNAVASDRARVTDYARRAFPSHRALVPMTVEDLQNLHALGHEIGSHGVNHLSMSNLSKSAASWELNTSRRFLEAYLGARITGFAYPYGDTANCFGDTDRWVQEAGYDYAVTLKRGRVAAKSEPFLLPREHVEGNWPLAHLRFFLGR